MATSDMVEGWNRTIWRQFGGIGLRPNKGMQWRSATLRSVAGMVKGCASTDTCTFVRFMLEDQTADVRR